MIFDEISGDNKNNMEFNTKTIYDYKKDVDHFF
jgi:hypothetical protein